MSNTSQSSFHLLMSASETRVWSEGSEGRGACCVGDMMLGWESLERWRLGLPGHELDEGVLARHDVPLQRHDLHVRRRVARTVLHAHVLLEADREDAGRKRRLRRHALIRRHDDESAVVACVLRVAVLGRGSLGRAAGALSRHVRLRTAPASRRAPSLSVVPHPHLRQQVHTPRWTPPSFSTHWPPLVPANTQEEKRSYANPNPNF
mmetsp:Transcript_35785/g.112336  ORF Transcript_35785/g.112336 Transcript_35785/m.112336 type:complete len:206 (-) Transcript_35785:80-697(-)